MSENQKLSNRFDQKMGEATSKNYRGGVEYLFLTKPGQYHVRILQKTKDALEPAFEDYMLHKNIYHPDYQRTGSFKCLGRACPMCFYAEEYAKVTRLNDQWRFKKQQAFFYFVIDRSVEKLKIMQASYLAQMAIVDVVKDMDRNNINIQDFEEGRDILIDVKLSNNKLIYKCYPKTSRENKAVSEMIIEELKIVETIKPLTKLYKDYSFAEIKKILSFKSIKNNQPKQKAPSKGSLTEQYNLKMKIDDQKQVNEETSNEDALTTIEESVEKKDK